MPKEFGRNQRVAQFIKEELSILIQRDFPLNEYGMITLVNVDLSSDLKNATIYITAFNNKESNEKLVADVNAQAGHFRHELSQMLTSRGVPSIRFKYDESIERAQRLTDIIDSVSTSDKEVPDE
jgi:ribosome-binding factor A